MKKNIWEDRLLSKNWRRPSKIKPLKTLFADLKNILLLGWSMEARENFFVPHETPFVIKIKGSVRYPLGYIRGRKKVWNYCSKS